MSVWNELPEIVEGAASMLSFKKRLDSNMVKMGMEEYGPNAGNWD